MYSSCFAASAAETDGLVLMRACSRWCGVNGGSTTESAFITKAARCCRLRERSSRQNVYYMYVGTKSHAPVNQAFLFAVHQRTSCCTAQTLDVKHCPPIARIYTCTTAVTLKLTSQTTSIVTAQNWPLINAVQLTLTFRKYLARSASRTGCMSASRTRTCRSLPEYLLTKKKECLFLLEFNAPP